MKPKNCLIFGASGQIGRHLIRKLTKNNYKVTAVTRNLHQKGYLLTQPLHDSQIIIEESQDAFLLEIEVYLTYELIERILGYGEDVKIISPDKLKDKVTDRFNKALGQYL